VKWASEYLLCRSVDCLQALEQVGYSGVDVAQLIIK
jgi:hypothetical protein